MKQLTNYFIAIYTYEMTKSDFDLI